MWCGKSNKLLYQENRVVLCTNACLRINLVGLVRTCVCSTNASPPRRVEEFHQNFLEQVKVVAVFLRSTTSSATTATDTDTDAAPAPKMHILLPGDADVCRRRTQQPATALQLSN